MTIITQKNKKIEYNGLFETGCIIKNENLVVGYLKTFPCEMNKNVKNKEYELFESENVETCKKILDNFYKSFDSSTEKNKFYYNFNK